jgi:hypothetical protein
MKETIWYYIDFPREILERKNDSTTPLELEYKYKVKLFDLEEENIYTNPASY